ncbi:hypothetical protein IWQ54_006468 [Labrenzia sp. EL_195]|nr:hypothetical protein [Labrenzia sp. EL_195]
MTLETGGFQLTGGMVAFAGYAAFNLFFGGQFIGERMAEKMNWQDQCQANILASVEKTHVPAQPPASGVCNMLFGNFSAEGRAYCDRYGAAFDAPANAITGMARQREEELYRKRLSHAAGHATSRCSCAVSVTLERHRVPLALHTGSLRLLSSAPVNSFQSELISSLNSPQCAMKG